MKTTLETINKKLSDLRLEQMRLEAENFQSKIMPVLKASIGKTFAYRNNSSGGDSKKWDVFRKLLAVVFSEYNAWLVFEECAIQGDGRSKLETTMDLVHRSSKPFPLLDLGWKECDPGEYEAQRAATLQEIANPVQLLKHCQG